LLYDREWALVTPDGAVITQKRLPGLTQLQPEVDLAAGVLRVTAHGVQQQLVIQLQQQPQASRQQQQQQDEQLVRVCGDTVCSQVVASTITAATAAEPDSAAAAADRAAVTYDAQAWFTAVLGVPCKLVRQLDNSRSVKQQNTKSVHHTLQHQDVDSYARSSSRRTSITSTSSSSSSSQTNGQTLGFANEGQYLMVNQASVDAVRRQLAAAAAAVAAPGSSSSSTADHALAAAAADDELDVLRFRPNLVVEGFRPWAEDSWSSITVGGSSVGMHCSTTTTSSSSGSRVASAAAAAAVVLDVVGACGRCDMVRIDQVTGQRHGGQLLSLLAKQRRQGGRLNFGLLLAHQTPAVVGAAEQAAAAAAGLAGASAQHERWLHVGDAVVAELIG
jgi:uncharacterized protein YcbX